VIERPKTFMEKYGVYLTISLVSIIIIVGAAGAVLLRRRRPVVIEMAEKKKALEAPKTIRLEGLMKTVYSMLSEKKADLDVKKYLEEQNLEDNIIKSVLYEMKTKNNRIDQLIDFSKKQFSKGKPVEEVRETLEKAGWARNIIEIATEE